MLFSFRFSLRIIYLFDWVCSVFGFYWRWNNYSWLMLTGEERDQLSNRYVCTGNYKAGLGFQGYDCFDALSVVNYINLHVKILGRIVWDFQDQFQYSIIPLCITEVRTQDSGQTRAMWQNVHQLCKYSIELQWAFESIRMSFKSIYAHKLLFDKLHKST